MPSSDIVNQNTDARSEGIIEELLLESLYKVLIRVKGNQQWPGKRSDVSGNGKPLPPSICLKVKEKAWFSEFALPVGKNRPTSLMAFGGVLWSCQSLAWQGGNWGNKNCNLSPPLTTCQ